MEGAKMVGTPGTWCVTGVAGFIGSHLLEALLRRNHRVTGVDDFSTGLRSGLEEVRLRVAPEQWARFRLVEGDIRSWETVSRAVEGAEFVLHQAALASVPGSLDDPQAYHAVNVTGFVNVLEASRRAGVRRVVYASSSAVYGDFTDMPAREDRIGRPLSPYALSKRVNEEYAAVYRRCFGLETLGLRYFNVFGPRQNPRGPYAAVIPRWIEAWKLGQPVEIFGTGASTRDFCPVSLVVELNLRAALVPLSLESPGVLNVGSGRATAIGDLARLLHRITATRFAGARTNPPREVAARAGDIRDSVADMSLAWRCLGHFEVPSLESGLEGLVAAFPG